MIDPMDGFKKVARDMASARKAVDAAMRALSQETPGADAVLAALEKALDRLDGLKGVDAAAASLCEWLNSKAVDVRVEAENNRALLAGNVASDLQSDGINVSGNLPRLRAGVFTLEFEFGKRGCCTVWFGPMKYKLASCPMEAEAIAGQVRDLQGDLFEADWDEGAFLADVEVACRVCSIRLGLQQGDRVPLSMVLSEVAFMLQDRRFLSDPKREFYKSFGRVEFAARLSRLKSWRLGDRELRLDVATMEQTRSPSDHLWVPHGQGMDGVNYSTARIVEVA